MSIMHRREFLTTIGLAGSANLLKGVPNSVAAADKASRVSLGPKSLLHGTPAVFAPAADGFTVSCPLAAAALVWLEYGETDTLGTLMKGDAQGFVPHDDKVVKIRLRGLKSGTRYYWRAHAKPLRGGATTFTKTYATRTLDPGAQKAAFTVWNDTHDNAQVIRQLHDAREPEADFLLWNGDVSNDVNDRKLLPALYVSPPGVDLAEGAPIFSVRGNHDVRGIWANKMTDYVDFPGGYPYYGFRVGPLGVIVLDTGEDKPDDHPSLKGVAAFQPLIRKQAAWLEQAIASPSLRDAPYRILFCHIPLRWSKEQRPNYARGGYDYVSLRGQEAWQGALARWKTQVVISGHTHKHAWLEPTAGFRFAQLVGGGRTLNDATRIQGSATADALRLTTLNLKGETLHEAIFKPLRREKMTVASRTVDMQKATSIVHSQH
ncbi:MAG: metallophosphoesterase [Puniceicoccales bacterium]|jgi:predicted phosphodiesterase|nr:metallophosphoesterase [Puniceicoccales bacterium]